LQIHHIDNQMTDPGKKKFLIFKKKPSSPAPATGGKSLLKKKDPVATAVNNTFKKAQASQDQRFNADVAKEQAIKSGNEAAGKKAMPQGSLADKGKFATALAVGRSAAGKANKDAGVENLATRKVSGEYNAAPAVKGGTKQQMRKSFLRVKKNSASPQAKAAAKRVFR
jgi:hypothetical protein